jgi:uncharacterized membrane protein
MIKLTKKTIELLDAVTSVPYSRKSLGYTIGRGLDAVLPFTCYSYWFSCYFDQRGKLMKAQVHVHLCIWSIFVSQVVCSKYILQFSLGWGGAVWTYSQMKPKVELLGLNGMKRKLFTTCTSNTRKNGLTHHQ